MSKNKPRWGKPKLIIFIRGKQEEMALVGCKVSGISGNPGGTYSACRVWQMEGGRPVTYDCLGYCHSTQSS